MKQFIKVGIVLILVVFKAQGQSKETVADSLYLVGNYTAAINAYSELGDENASLQIARAYNAIGNKEKAILQYQSILLKNSSNTLASFELGKLYDKTKNYEEAIGLFQSLTADSQNPEFYYYLGKSLQSNLGYDEATAALKKAIELDNTHIKSIFLLGKYYIGIQEHSNAIEIVDLGLETAPNDVALINLKALANFNLENYELAAPLFEHLIELGEKKPFIYKKLGYSYANRWKYEEAKKAYRTLGSITNYEADGYLGLAQVFFKEKELDSAAVYYKKAIAERRYIFDEEYRSLGRIARLKGELKKSLDYYTKAWEEDKVNQFSYWQVCVLSDEYYKDPKIKLAHYKKLLSDYDNLMPFLRERAVKRVKELNEEIFFDAE